MKSSHSAGANLQTLREFVAEFSSELGFNLAGVASITDAPELEYFSAWVESGRGGEMGYLEQRNDQGKLKRSSLVAAFPWARSIILCAASYDSPAPLSIGPAPEGTGWIARYAQPGSSQGGAMDYHAVLLERLRVMEAELHARLGESGMHFESRSYVDTGPLIERVYAQYAGIGWTGKNTCTIHPEIGSCFFLGAIVTSLDAENPDPLANLLPDRCGTCTRCIDACPTNALDEPYRMDASRCIAYLTIEKRGSIPEELRAPIGRNVFGCDICQDVCPWNAKARRNHASDARVFPRMREELVNPRLAWLGSLDRREFNKLFRGSPVERTKWSGLMRNVAIAMGNSDAEEFLPQLQAWSGMQDEPALAEAAQWAIGKICTALARP